jgi:hypothetical protein
MTGRVILDCATLQEVALEAGAGGDQLQIVEPVKDFVRTLNPNIPLLEARSYDDL